MNAMCGVSTMEPPEGVVMVWEDVGIGQKTEASQTIYPESKT